MNELTRNLEQKGMSDAFQLSEVSDTHQTIHLLPRHDSRSAGVRILITGRRQAFFEMESYLLTCAFLVAAHAESFGT